ncbi:RVP_2 domain-containing protein [Gossypium australe]|uniref:RVP_2 domain-containing protein n=1 Tax=Gossypium australe TaxID=47621 RepID=A0A5B6V972_9ROSI|nr:RVP_2 domain-containing protein [Gossypium australe]
MNGVCLVCELMEYHVSDCPMRAVMVRDQPTAAVVAIAVALARMRGRDKGDGGRGVGQRGVARGGNGSPARAYAVRKPRTREVTDVIVVDSGATRSFILSDVVRELGIPVEASRLGFMVKIPLGDSVVVDQVYRCCPLMVQGQGFDVILGMDWLTEHQVKVDCEVKMVTLCCADGSEVVVREKFELLSNVISSLRANKLVQKGCEAYLAYVLNADSKELSLDEIRAIYDFPNVFPDWLSSLPLDREVEFGIELYPGTSLVSIVLYRMAPKELKELKIQLQELLD